MKTRFNKPKYGQRWQVETVNSMIKRLQGSALRARKYWSQHREIVLRVLTHNIMILRRWVFYRAVLIRFPFLVPFRVSSVIIAVDNIVTSQRYCVVLPDTHP